MSLSLEAYSHLCTPGASSSRITLNHPRFVAPAPAPASARIARRLAARVSLPRAALALVLCASTAVARVGATPIGAVLASDGDGANAMGRATHPARALLARFAIPPPIPSSLATAPILVAAADYRHVYLPDTFVELHQMFSPGFIVLSYLIAFVGSLCTLELLIRRTSNAGWRNQLLLLSAGICFGAVSTFSMHFVFNNALTLTHPDVQNGDPLSLMYAPGYTVLSLVASCTAMTIAFFVMSTSVAEWYCVPGGRDRRRARLAESKLAPGEEYRRWKSAHKAGAIRRGTVHVTTLVKQAHQRVAKWSLMEEHADAQANKESEMEFRLGSGKKTSTFDPDPLLPTSTSPTALGPAMLPPLRAASPSSLPSWPATPTYPPAYPAVSMSRSHTREPSVDMFTPNYNFPPRAESVASLIVRESPSPDSIRRGSLTLDYPPAIPDPSRRRASLPVVLPREGYTNPLSRILSLPEQPEQVSPKLTSPGLEKGDTTVLPEHPETELEVRHGTPRVRLVDSPKVPTRVGRFLGFDVVTREDIWKIVLTGTIAGFGVAGMHYIGQLSIVGMPYIAYDPAYVVGSIIIAAGAVVVALYIMFIMLRPKLKHGILYKICVALILAVAVCAMHFCGMMGTTYAWPPDQPITKHDLLQGTNGAIVGIVSALAFAACLACGVFFAIEGISARRERQRRRRVVVASIMLDEHDRVLVNSTDGLPPMCDIASLSGNALKSDKSTQGDSASSMIGMDLSTGHEAFVSALKLSWFWKNPDFNPTMSADAPPTVSSTLQEIRRGSFQTVATSMTSVSRPTRVTVQRFLERFVTSSGQLAVRLTGHSEGIQRIGVLYDQILTTGWVKLHNSSDTVSKGQLIILVRRVTSQYERDDLLTRHFIFADSSAVAMALQKTLSVPLEHVNPLLQDVKLFCDSTARVSLQPGTLYAGVAVVQATPFDGLRILLEQENRSQLPLRELCSFNANPSSPASADELSGTVEEIGEALTWLEGMSLLSIINRNLSSPTAIATLGGPRVAALLSAFERAIVPMLDAMLSSADMEHIIPRLKLHPVLVPLTPGTPRPDPRCSYVPPYIVVLYANYDAAVNTFTDRWLPYNLFRAQNECVMARSVGVAAQMMQDFEMASPVPPMSAGIGGLGGTQPQSQGQWTGSSRRPSRVQFDEVVEEVPFEGYSFPPKPAGSGSGTATASASASASAAAGGGSGLSGGLPTSAGRGPRRSSLARTGMGMGMGAHDAGHGHGYGYGGGGGGGGAIGMNGLNQAVGTVLPGVAAWDPDWLLKLLKGGLRTEM